MSRAPNASLCDFNWQQRSWVETTPKIPPCPRLMPAGPLGRHGEVISCSISELAPALVAAKALLLRRAC